MRIGRIGLVLGLWLYSWQGFALPIIYQATGTREQVQPVIDQFKHDIIYGPGGSEQNPPQFLGQFKEATFDDVGPGLTDTYAWQPQSSTAGNLNALTLRRPASLWYFLAKSAPFNR